MDLDLAREMADTAIQNFGLNIPCVIVDKIPMLGFCKFDDSVTVPVRIGLQKRFVELNTPYLIMDTVLHEIAHALIGVPDRENHHNAEWNSRYLSIGGIGVENAEKLLVRPGISWTAICRNCGTINADDLGDFDFDNFMVCCVRCDSELERADWTRGKSAGESYRVCDLQISHSSPATMPTSASGRRLLELAAQYQ